VHSWVGVIVSSYVVGCTFCTILYITYITVFYIFSPRSCGCFILVLYGPQGVLATSGLHACHIVQQALLWFAYHSLAPITPTYLNTVIRFRTEGLAEVGFGVQSPGYLGVYEGTLVVR
jgi:hypothetical protein